MIENWIEMCFCLLFCVRELFCGSEFRWLYRTVLYRHKSRKISRRLEIWEVEEMNYRKRNPRHLILRRIRRPQFHSQERRTNNNIGIEVYMALLLSTTVNKYLTRNRNTQTINLYPLRSRFSPSKIFEARQFTRNRSLLHRPSPSFICCGKFPLNTWRDLWFLDPSHSTIGCEKRSTRSYSRSITIQSFSSRRQFGTKGNVISDLIWTCWCTWWFVKRTANMWGILGGHQN